MIPNYDLAATTAMEILVKSDINAMPIFPMPILREYPGVLLTPFEDMATTSGTKRSQLISLFGDNKDAATILMNTGKVKYVVVYNQYLPFEITRRALARELGHIALGHDGQTRTMDVRMAEAMCFAHHLLCPRPILKAIQDDGIPVTLNVIGNISGCNGQCVEEMRNIPGVNVPAELNRKIRERFSRFLDNFLAVQRFLSSKDNSPVIDLGSYMDGYEE